MNSCIRFFPLVFLFSIFVAFVPIDGLAQTAGAKPKFVIVNTAAFFEDKVGITKYLNATAALEREFAPVNADIRSIRTRIDTLSKEIEQMRTAKAAATSVATKQAEVEQLLVEGKRKSEDAAKRLERRQNEVLPPITADVRRALQEYALKNGYEVVLDAPKLVDSGFLLAVHASADITFDFIKSYNSRPPTSAAAPK